MSQHPVIFGTPVGISDTKACQLCGDPEGNDYHRYHECSIHWWQRDNCLSEDTKALRDELAEIDKDHPLLVNGVIPASMMPEPVEPIKEEVVTTDRDETCGITTGVAFVDGLCIDNTYPQYGRAGWAVAVLGHQGYDKHILKFAKHGPLVGYKVDIAHAELMAVLQTMRQCLPPLLIKCDRQEIVDDWNKGNSHCVSPENHFCQLWRRVWWYFGELCGSSDLEQPDLLSVTICKVKAHAKEETPVQDHIDYYDWLGNRWADKLAGI